MPPYVSKMWDKKIKMIFLQSLLSITAGWFLTTFILSELWTENPYLFHSILEILCLFIANSTFFVVWHTYPRSSQTNLILGFGLLIMVVFDSFHIFYYPELILYPPGPYDPSLWYCLAGRLTESVIFLLTTFNFTGQKINKWAGLTISLCLALGISYLILISQGSLLIIPTDVYLVKLIKIIEFITISLFILSLYLLLAKINSNNMPTYKYILTALVIAIPSEICFALFYTTDSFYLCLGHVLKSVSYYYLFRGIFSSAVTYPYTRLEESGRYMADLLNGLPIGITTYDHMGQLNFANKMTETLFGCDQKEIMGLNEVMQINNRLFKPDFDIETGLKTPLKNRIITISRKDTEIVLSIDVHKLADGYMYLFTEAKKEQELENLKLQTQTILNSSSNAVALYDSRNNLIMCNKALESLLETDAGKFIGINIKELDKLVKLRPKHSVRKTLSRKKQNLPYEVSIVSLKGNRRDLILHIDVIYNLDREIIGRICVGSDITGFKKEQQKNQQQEKFVLLGEMAAGVVHEIRNPLTSIKGFSQLISSKARDEQIREYARIIDSTANDVSKVVSAFLAFAKPRLPVLQELSLNQLLKSMKALLDSQLQEKGVNSDYFFVTGEKPVMADGEQIRQAIGIVVNNAVEAMADWKKPYLTVSTGFSELTCEMLITITDNGKGMVPEELLKVGTPFYTTKDYGTGLGMSVCYQIINEHGGRIEIESKPEKGTSVIMSLPCKLPSLRYSPPGSNHKESIHRIS